MLHGVDTFTLSTGTVCTVEWTRPEVGVDITEEEQKSRMQKFASTWRGFAIDNPPPWLDK